MKSTDIASQGRLPGLDGLRAVAVLMVLIHHFVPPSDSGSLFSKFVSRAGYGVEIFFVISGFLITHLLLREEFRNGRISLPLFYARRALRILPPLVVFLLTMMIAMQAGLLFIPEVDLIASLLFVRNFVGTSPETGHLWTLAIEEQYYLLWPAVLVLIRSHRLRVLLTTCFIFLSPLWFELNRYIVHGDYLNMFRTDLRLAPLAVGSLLALLLWAPISHRWLIHRAINNSWFAMMAPGVIGLLFLANITHIPIVRSFVVTLNWIIIALFINCLVHNSQSTLTQLFEFRPLAWVGTLSYSLYLWQQPFAPYVPRMTPAWFRVFPVNLCFALAFAVASYYLLERPLLSMRGRLRPDSKDARQSA
ncbi:hypothetical protein BH11PLA2_BH11PLA2_35160 [soil metagenome]